MDEIRVIFNVLLLIFNKVVVVIRELCSMMDNIINDILIFFFYFYIKLWYLIYKRLLKIYFEIKMVDFYLLKYMYVFYFFLNCLKYFCEEYLNFFVVVY